jgi:hypothetical protein
MQQQKAATAALPSNDAAPTLHIISRLTTPLIFTPHRTTLHPSHHGSTPINPAPTRAVALKVKEVYRRLAAAQDQCRHSPHQRRRRRRSQQVAGLQCVACVQCCLEARQQGAG